MPLCWNGIKVDLGGSNRVITRGWSYLGLTDAVADSLELRTLLLPTLGPGEERTVSLQLQSPPSTGLYQSQWKMCLPSGSLGGGEGGGVAVGGVGCDWVRAAWLMDV